jgi:DNA topoisomerase-1
MYDNTYGGYNISRAKGKYKWNTLSHNGIKFPEEYIQKNIPIIYDGREIYLSKDAEEIAFLYAKYLDTEYITNGTFNRNFFSDWKKILGKDTEIQSLSLCDFSKMKKFLYDQKEQKKLGKKDETLSDNKENTLDDKYKIAMVDEKPQSVANYKMEPVGIFIGRGKNPHLGKIKRRIYPEDITINIGKGEKIPDPPIGHKWGKIIHDRSVEWLVSWKDNITGKTKYLWLAAHSDMKTSNDQKKYDIARKLKRKIKDIHETNEQNMKSSDPKIRQIATALYFIDKLAIRVGNEKAEDETDTVGVTSLRIEHIELGENNTVTLNFLGKDSVPYTNTITVDNVVYNNVKELLKDKDKEDQVFNLISSNDVNKYLQEFMRDLTAKVFRTYNASNLFQKELRKISNKYEEKINNTEIVTSNVEDTDTEQIITDKQQKSTPITPIDQQKTSINHQKAILDDFAKANAKVAKMMNHQKNISAGYKKSVDKINETISNLKKQILKARRSSKKSPEKIRKIKEKIDNYKSKKELVKEMKNISLGTSKANYIDPRITVAFLKKHGLDVNKIFSKTLQEKFKWAFEVDETFKF